LWLVTETKLGYIGCKGGLKKMSNQSQQKSSEWLTYVRKMTALKKAGQFAAKDKFGALIMLEWEIIDQQSPRLTEKIKSLSEILVQIYTQQEVQFARKFPDAVANEYFLKPLAPLFANGIKRVDWDIVIKQTRDVFQQFFTTTDFTKSSVTDDIHLFVVVKDKDAQAALGMIQLFITPEYPYGSIKAAFYGVMPAEQQRELEKLLMCSIFKLVPDTKRIFLHTRMTNEDAIMMYNSWGFVQFPGNLAGWPDFEYLAEKSNILQQMAETFKYGGKVGNILS
jgi:hypothetical protein